MASEAKKTRDEQALADYYQSRQGDVSTWAKQPRVMRRKRGEGPTTTFAIRLTPEELEELQKAAAERRISLSEFIRSTSLSGARLHGART